MASSLLRIASSRAVLVKSCAVVPSSAYHGRAQIGSREVVGFGYNGEYNYADRVEFPMPAVRFREIKGELLPLKEKEKGDWKKLSTEEKKTLYRASFCQTFSEFKAPSGDWKICLTGIFIVSALSLWYYTWMKKYVYPPLPESFSPEAKEAQLKRMIDMRVNKIDGLASKWDYQKGQWKE